MEQKNIVTFLVSYTKKDLIEFEPAVNFHKKKALIIAIIYTLMCILALFYKHYILGIILFAYSIYGVFCHYIQISRFYKMNGKTEPQEPVSIINNKLTTSSDKLKIPDDFLNTVEQIIETKNLVVIITSTNTFLLIRKDSFKNITLDEFKTYLLNNCPNLLDKRINYFIKFPKYYLLLTIIFFTCGLLSTILYIV